MSDEVAIFKHFLLDLAHIIDQGEVYTVDEIFDYVCDGTIIKKLSENHSVINQYDVSFKKYLTEGLERQAGGYGKIGIENNGLCLLIIYTTFLLIEAIAP